MLKDISNSFCIHCCGAEKKFECDTQERTCLKLAQFLIDCNKTINKKQRGVYTPEDLLPQTKYTPEYIDSLVGTESTLSPAEKIIMKTIKERAEDYANENWTLDEAYIACEDGYIKGATEQKEIDIDKACEWLKSHAYHLATSDIKLNIENFRKAMNK